MSSQLITSKDANNICKCFVKTDVVKLTVCLVKHNCSKGILIILLSQWGPKLKIFNGSLKNIHFCCCSSNYRMSRKGNRECLGSNSILGLQELRGEERLGSFETKGLLL